MSKYEGVFVLVVMFFLLFVGIILGRSFQKSYDYWQSRNEVCKVLARNIGFNNGMINVSDGYCHCGRTNNVLIDVETGKVYR